MNIYMEKGLEQIGEVYEGGEGRHEEGVSRVTHLTFELHPRCSAYD